jgi:predicted aminopeptidase
VADWLADASTPGPLRERLQLSQRMRDFASAELKLPDNDSYRAMPTCSAARGVERGGRARAVADAQDLVLPGAGLRRLPRLLRRERRPMRWPPSCGRKAGGQRLWRAGLFSTLGWSNWLGGDPLLNTFINWPEGDLARLIFHELAHQVAYAADDTTFNESFATAVERIGGRRWLAAAGSREAEHEYARCRPPAPGLPRADAGPGANACRRCTQRAARRRQAPRKAALMAQMRAEYQALKAERWGGFAGYDGWFERANNASFGVQAAYNELVPAFERLFERSGRDFPASMPRCSAWPACPRPSGAPHWHHPTVTARN